MPRNLVTFDIRITRAQAKAICQQAGLTIHDLDKLGKIDLGVGRAVVVFTAKGPNRRYMYVDTNNVEGLLDVRRMPADVQQAAIDRMCSQLEISREKLQTLLGEQRENEAQLAAEHALLVG